MMRAWTRDELARIGGAEALQLASARPDGTLRPYITMWVVRVGGQGRDVIFADATHHAKYDRYGPRIVGSVVGPAIEGVTIRLVPRAAA